MAYLTAKTLTCPSCGHTEPLTWITGVPLDNKPSAGRGYVRVHESEDWNVEKADGKIFVYCPNCATEVTQRNLQP
jgi:predicted RNA-binding Zn-ribbon protein involved in translation (DUF1610 family)